jgi:hypothetical protein
MALERLRGKDSSTKAQIALISALCVTGVIALVWMTTLPARFDSMALTEDESIQETKNSITAVGSFLETTRSQIGNLIEGAAPEEEVVLDEDTALGSLDNDMRLYDRYEPYESASDTEVPTESLQKEVAPKVKREPETPTSRVILIGTSTPRKSE